MPPVGSKPVITTLVMILSAAQMPAQTTQYIYRLAITGCDGASGRYVQSAFKVVGKSAIVTALHGVAGCSSIEAFDVRGSPTFEGRKLKIGRADVRNDVVELVSEPPLPAEGGLNPASMTPRASERLRVYGFPSGRVLSRGTEVRVADPPMVKLNSWPLTAAVRTALSTRKSPDLENEFVDIDGVLLPGHSGAPLLNEANQVVAIANGGLEGGKDNRTWAVAWARIQWAALDEAALRGLGRAPSTLFAFEPEEAPLPLVATQSVTVGTRGVVSVGNTGFIPGLRGTLNPNLDSSNRTYLYASNIAIDGGQLQPVPFNLNQILRVEDSQGNRFSITITSITRSGATISYEKLAPDPAGSIRRFDVSVDDEAGTGVSGASVQVTFSDGTYLSTMTNAQGRAQLENLKRSTGDVIVAHPSFQVLAAAAQSLRNPLSVRIRRVLGGGSLVLEGNTGQIPGLAGRLNPIRDSLNRTYFYADNIAIAGGKGQPVTISVNTPVEVEDSLGNRFALTFSSVGTNSSTIAYEQLATRRTDIQSFEVLALDEKQTPVGGVDVVLAFNDGTALTTTSTAQGIAKFVGVKQSVADIFVARGNYRASYVKGFDLRQRLYITYRQSGPTSSGVFAGRTGYIPSLSGRLDPILDSLGRTYLYAEDIQIDGGKPQPVDFSIGQTLTLRDRNGAIYQLSFLAITNSACLFEYTRITP